MDPKYKACKKCDKVWDLGELDANSPARRLKHMEGLSYFFCECGTTLAVKTERLNLAWINGTVLKNLSSFYLEGACLVHNWLTQAEFRGDTQTAEMYRRILSDVQEKFELVKSKESI